MAALSTTGSKRSWWSLAMRVTTGIVIIAVVVLLFNLARRLDWMAVLDATRNINRPTLILAFVMACGAYLAYSSFDLLARHYTGHQLPTLKVVAVALISYAMNTNLGVLVGGIAVRLRLYRRLGLGRAQAARIVLFSTATNWLGYGWLAGMIFMADVIPLPGTWDIGRNLLQFVGLCIFLAAASYLGFCTFSKRRSWTFRGQTIDLPSGKVALMQSGMAMVSWTIMAGIIYLLLEGRADYFVVLSILLFCSIAAVIAHIPGGLGVTEAIFTASLAGQIPAHEVLASVLMYRVVYGLVPLSIALVAYLGFEAHFRREGSPSLADDDEEEPASSVSPRLSSKEQGT